MSSPSSVHRLGPITAGVVEQDDGAAAVLRDRVANDRVDAGPLPVPRVDIGQDRDVAVGVRVLDQLPVLVVDRVGRERVRGADQRRRPAVHADQGELLLRQLPARLQTG